MNAQFCDEKFLRIMDEFALNFFEKKEDDISYDAVTSLILKRINWGVELNFVEASSYLQLQKRHLSRLDYYYDQLIKKIYCDEDIDLSASSYIDFWNCLSGLGFDLKIKKYKFVAINCSNSFEFLRDIKSEIKKSSYITRFKIKTIEMMKYKGRGGNEVK